MLKSLIKRTCTSFLLICAAAPSMNLAASPEEPTSVHNFHRKALAGEPVDVVFFGGSLTWGANASDPLTTSYRGRMMQWLQEQYPNTQIRFHDAAIGGSGSQLGLFRLERDVLPHNPDLVFLDFSVNDGAEDSDIEKFSSYETLVRRMVEEEAAVMPVFMMFKWHVGEPGSELPPRHLGHIELANAYGLPWANTIPYVNEAVASGSTTIETLWPFDGAHPDDPGYALFFEAVRDRYLEATENQDLVAIVPEEPVYGEYPSITRLILSEEELPEGWEIEKTYRTSLWFDGLASRWMGDVAVASKERESAPLEFEFEGSLVGFFGERNGLTPEVKIWVDDELVLPPKAKEGQTTWHLATDRFAPPKKGTGNLFLWTLIADDLEEGPHTVKIEPIWEGADKDAELRIESLCYAGAE